MSSKFLHLISRLRSYGIMNGVLLRWADGRVTGGVKQWRACHQERCLRATVAFGKYAENSCDSGSGSGGPVDAGRAKKPPAAGEDDIHSVYSLACFCIWSCFGVIAPPMLLILRFSLSYYDYYFTRCILCWVGQMGSSLFTTQKLYVDEMRLHFRFMFSNLRCIFTLQE